MKKTCNLDNSEICYLLSILRTFKLAYKEENGVITIGDIRELVSHINLLEECVKKQKRVPAKVELKQGLFWKLHRVYYCPNFGCMVDLKNKNYCPNCGQKLCG